MTLAAECAAGEACLSNSDSVRCPICSGYLMGPVMLRIEQVRLVRCGGCESWICLPRPSAQQQAMIHDSESYYACPYFEDRRSEPASTDRHCREAFAQIARALDLRSLRGERVLDVGCDTGSFLCSAADHFGIVPVGIDISSRAVCEARAKGVEAYHADLETAPEQLRDSRLITAIDIIEHVVDPTAFLRQIHARLRRGGVAYLQTPNIDSVVYGFGAMLGRFTAGRPRGAFQRLFPDHHVQYFTAGSLAALVRDCGFDLVALHRRTLPFRDTAVSLMVRIGVTALQTIDRATGNMILLCALLRKP